MSDKSKNFPHDASYKDFFSHPAMVASLLRDFVDEPFVAEMDLGTLERLSGEYVGKDFTKGFSDMVWRVRWRNREWCYVALLLEFQSAPDPLMPFRLAGYTSQLLLRLAKEDKSLRSGRFPAVLPIVLYTGDAPWNAPVNAADMFGLVPEALGAYLLRQKHVLIDLCRLDAGRAEQRDSLTAQVARFRQARTIEEIEAVLADMCRVLRAHPELQRVFVDFVTLWLRHCGVPGRWERKVNNIDEVNEMIAFDFNRWKESYTETLKTEFMAEGLAEGREQGRDEEKKATIRQLLKMGGFSLESIAEITRLSLDEVRAIAAQDAPQ